MQDPLRDGFSLLAAGNTDQASGYCKRLLGAKPALVEAHFLVGLITAELQETWTAVSAFGLVTKLQPDHGATWSHLARLFLGAVQPVHGDDAHEKAVEHNA